MIKRTLVVAELSAALALTAAAAFARTSRTESSLSRTLSAGVRGPKRHLRAAATRTGGEPCPHERRREARQRRDGPRLAGRAARPREAVMCDPFDPDTTRSEEHPSELQSLIRNSSAV